MRINKYLAKSGIGSRRGVEKFIVEGKVSINGKVVTDLSRDIQENDRVFLNGKEVQVREDFIYYKINKPAGYTTTVKDPFAERVILDLIKEKRRIFPVGRLDKDSCGLLLLTNDGDLTYRLTHPKHHMSKTYRVRVKGAPSDAQIKKLEQGILMDGYKTKECVIKRIKDEQSETSFEVILWEGRNRQIRKLFDSINHPVVFLKRIKIGEVLLGNLKEGQYEELSTEELEYLRGI